MKFLVLFVLFAMEVSSSIIEENYNDKVLPMDSADATNASTVATSAPAGTNGTPGVASFSYKNVMNLPQKPVVTALNLTQSDKTAVNMSTGATIPPTSTTSKSNIATSPAHHTNPDELVVLSHSQDTLMNNTTSMPSTNNVTTAKVTTPKPHGSKSSASSMNSISIFLWSTALCSFLYQLN